MRFTDIFSLTKQSIKGNRLRSNLTIAIITIGIFALISIITIIKILENNIVSSFSAMGTNTFTIQSQGLKRSGRHGRRKQSNQNPTITYSQAALFKKNYDYPSQMGISVLASNDATIKSKKKTSNPNIKVLGVDEQYLPLSGTNLISGRNFTSRDVQQGSNICFVGNKIAKNYFNSPLNALDKKLFVGNTPYQIIGVLEKTGSSFIDRTDNQIFISINNARRRFPLTGRSYVISVKIKDIKYMKLAQDASIGQMRTIKKLKLNETENFSIISSDGLANMLLDNVRIITITAAAIGFITLLGAAIGLMNIMLVAVAERTREIGVSKAIGADNKTIRRQFLTEAIYISIKGGLLGTVLGILSGNLFSIFFDSPFIVPWKWVFLGMGTCFVVGLLSGIYPALKASRLNPINALRYE